MLKTHASLPTRLFLHEIANRRMIDTEGDQAGRLGNAFAECIPKAGDVYCSEYFGNGPVSETTSST